MNRGPGMGLHGWSGQGRAATKKKTLRSWMALWFRNAVRRQILVHHGVACIGTDSR